MVYGHSFQASVIFFYVYNDTYLHVILCENQPSTSYDFKVVTPDITHSQKINPQEISQINNQSLQNDVSS